MEPIENKPMPSNPKPTDEVQLHIETVTPESDKEAIPTKEVTEEQSKLEEDLPEDSKNRLAVDKTQTVENETEASEEESPAAVEDNKDIQNSGDARDQIETINP